MGFWLSKCVSKAIGVSARLVGSSSYKLHLLWKSCYYFHATVGCLVLPSNIKVLKKSVTLGISQSLECLLNTKLNPWGVHSSAIMLCQCKIKLYTSGNSVFMLPSSCQSSFQNTVLTPSANLIMVLTLNSFDKIQIDFHKLTPQGVVSSYVIQLPISSDLSFGYFHSHFIAKALFWFFRCLIANPSIFSHRLVSSIWLGGNPSCLCSVAIEISSKGYPTCQNKCAPLFTWSK